MVMVGSIGKKAVVDKDGAIVARDILPITVTVDHRFLDGAQGAAMAANLKKYLTDPTLLEDL
jgi:pyruvate dehydrogenase E2 component (dihydrolipoamide acetyltransferase)